MRRAAEGVPGLCMHNTRLHDAHSTLLRPVRPAPQPAAVDARRFGQGGAAKIASGDLGECRL